MAIRRCAGGLDVGGYSMADRTLFAGFLVDHAIQPQADHPQRGQAREPASAPVF